MAAAPAILWFRNDFRIGDNPALAAAAKEDAPLLALFILDEGGAEQERPGGASRWWLHGSLEALDRKLRGLGGRLILRRGDSARVLTQLIEETGAIAVHTARAYEPEEIRREEAVAEICDQRGIVFRRHPGRLLFEPESLATKSGSPYQVFTPFWKAARALNLRAAAPTPRKLQFAQVSSDALDDWRLRPTRPDWSGGLRETWTPGEAAASAALGAFVGKDLGLYAENRSDLATAPTSHLSPHLHFGEISPRTVWQAIEDAGRSRADRAGGEAFQRELLWRDFCHHLLFHFPQTVAEPLKPEFRAMAWRRAPADLEAWQQGRTGYPIVDAAMRQLWQQGWIPNRARMIAASFLVKHLLIDWREGAAWFMDTLVDADLANNTTNWQWVAGSGADAAPYFRIFNPLLQAAKFDPDSSYVRRFVPELAKLDPSDIHTPWAVPPDVLAAAGVDLGTTYPEPLIAHEAGRARALAAFEAIKGA